ncbi:anthranilate phosphoribosyltransferase [Synechococcus sp. PCC 7502]|uniref:anthranilate phosphoribosyltransferase family protein n=1 Tax=Synechococcus sp. PCC 7502 TaxID=1173263 RepID=UPI00029FC4CC|nr:anthranilate phosphoribosyltransferase family protein [Synechococcus sp. PCC 7502]AFY73749.1 anthranilate phosphoribosyltransferase [Synechococcus sp. PCC 7502]
MSQAFRTLLRKVASGTHTSKDLTRVEAEAALEMILTQEATPAQIGAFLVAHRIKRPTSMEMAGMLDAYDRFGGRLEPVSNSKPVIILSSPYDGRSRTAPISPLTAMVLAAAGINVITHGGDRMPTKAGIPFMEIWQGLDVHWQNLDLTQVQTVLNQTGFAFVYLADHFPLAQAIVAYRDQIGKRPPLATLELMWAPYKGTAHIACGFVHPPTEATMREAFALTDCKDYTTVKGSEGSCDLPRDRSAIIGLGTERLVLNARDFGFSNFEVPLTTTAELITDIQQVLAGEKTEYQRSLIWNSGFYLWRMGISPNLESGFTLAENLINSGKVREKLGEIKQAIANLKNP